MQSEISVKVSGDDKTVTQKYLCYDSITLSQDDPQLDQMVNETIKSFQGTPEDVVLKIRLVWS